MTPRAIAMVCMVGITALSLEAIVLPEFPLGLSGVSAVAVLTAVVLHRSGHAIAAVTAVATALAGDLVSGAPLGARAAILLAALAIASARRPRSAAILLAAADRAILPVLTAGLIVFREWQAMLVAVGITAIIAALATRRRVTV